MPIPDSPREVYNRNPLSEVLVQLRFPTILRVSSETPADFQEKIRNEYPLYTHEAGEPLIPGLPKEISDLIKALPAMPHQAPHHTFMNEGESRFISLIQDSLAVTEKKYTNWELFRNAIRLAEDAFRDIYAPQFYSRIGLRYIDFIDKEYLGLGNVRWSELLNEEFIGELGASDFADEVDGIATQSTIRIPHIQEGVVRIQHGLASPENSESVGYLIDSDFSVTRRCNPDDAFEALDALNNLGGRLFRWAIKPRLRDALEPTSI